MKKFVVLLIIMSFLAMFSLPAIADTQTLGTCLVDSLTGKERKQLAKWIYFAIAAHPEMVSFSNITNDDRIETDKHIGDLVTRLLVEDCASEVKVARKTDPLALQKAFELVGKVAMQELMNNQSVKTAISNYVKYADQNKINALFGGQ